MNLRLVAFHRILIQTFCAFSAFLAWHQISRWRETGGSVELACGVGSAVVAAGCVAYLFRARHLRR